MIKMNPQSQLQSERKVTLNEVLILFIIAALVVVMMFVLAEDSTAAAPMPPDAVSGNTLFTSSADGKTVYTWRVSKAVESPKYIGKVTVDE